ncbi:hypothetical protein ACIQNG_16085 [Streptomyces sp. NPDC091377]|uniref:hypothetical protein n=1 Tax=unclassified Streptomyces TaxID=2593676 RepID=UPI0038251146
MTDRQSPATTYLDALRGRLTADGCAVSTTRWAGYEVLTGSRSDRKARWFGTKAQLFVYAAVVPSVGPAELADFTRWALSHAKSRQGGIPGARNAAMVLPALIGDAVQPAAVQWAAQDARILETSVVGRPITVETTPEATRTAMYRGRVQWGGMFTGHVLEKARLYFP